MRKKPEYDRIFRHGRNIHTGHFRVIVLSAPAAISRLGLVVSRKVGRAHERNRVKRRLREYFRIRRQRLHPPLDVVVVAKRGAAELLSAQVAEELDTALRAWLSGPP